MPQTSAIEIFDTRTLRYLRTVSLGFGPGSLTVLDRHAGKGGVPSASRRQGRRSTGIRSFDRKEMVLVASDIPGD